MKTIGADWSHWESIIDWSRAWRWLPWAYFKATDGEDFVDSQFGNNQDGAREYGTPHAGYHWWQELQNPILQAEHFYETIGAGYKKRIIDVEPKTTCDSNKLKQLLDRDEQLNGNKAVIYTSKNYWNYLRPVPTWAINYEFILAQYSYKLTLIPPYVSKVVGWQFTDDFWFDGCNYAADGDWLFKSLDDTRDWFGNYHEYNYVPQPVYRTEMRVTADTLNVRSGPSTSYPITKQLHKGDIVEVYDISGQDAWIKHNDGWSCCKVGAYKYMFPKEQNVYTFLPTILNSNDE